MRKLLQKIDWKTRKWNITIKFLEITLHDGNACWGFEFLQINRNYTPYALLAFEFRLPNGAERKVFSITNWDFLYLSTYISNWVSDNDESILWGNKPTGYKKVLYNILNKIV